MAHLRASLGALLFGAVALGPVLVPTAHAQDEENLDDLGDDFLKEARKEQKKRRDADDEELGELDGDPMEAGLDEDPDWDVPPEPINLGLDEDPAEPGLGAPDGLPADDFFADDPPADLAPPAPPAAAPAAGKALDTKGKTPLAGSFPARVVSTDLDAVVIELPVLVARQAVDHVEDYWIVAEFYVLDRKVTETRTLVSRAGVSDLGPTLVWIKAQAPVLESSGKIDVKVKRVAEDGSARPLFAKAASYRLKG